MAGQGQRITRMLNTLGKGALAVGGGLFVAQSCLYTVDAGHQAVIFDRLRGGVMPNILNEGMHLYIPILQYPIFYEIRTRYTNISTSTPSRDLQTVNLTLRLLYRPNSDNLPALFRKLGKDYDERVLPSLGNEVLKAIVAKFDASELITQREEVSREIRSRLVERAEEFFIDLDDVSLTHLHFGSEFTKAIELKQVAQQDAERSKYVVHQKEQEKIAAITRAEGEAEAANLIRDATHGDPNFVQIRRLEAAREIAGTLARNPNVIYLPSTGGNFLLNLH